MTNVEITDAIRQTRASAKPIDAFDRKILGALVENAEISYADLGLQVGLSAPAVHERVKKLRASGTLRRTVALIDGPAVGKPVLAFVHVDSTGWCKTNEIMAFAELPEVEEVHSVAGDTSMLLKVRCASSTDLEALLSRLYGLPGVRSTRCYMVLSTYSERPAQAAITNFGLEG